MPPWVEPRVWRAADRKTNNFIVLQFHHDMTTFSVRHPYSVAFGIEMRIKVFSPPSCHTRRNKVKEATRRKENIGTVLGGWEAVISTKPGFDLDWSTYFDSTQGHWRREMLGCIDRGRVQSRLSTQTSENELRSRRKQEVGYQNRKAAKKRKLPESQKEKSVVVYECK